MTVLHGGQLLAACQRYGGQPQEWLDLSTGIAPWSYPLPSVPDRVWQRLPEEQDSLITYAADYYGVSQEQCCAVSGSQWAIEAIPRYYASPLTVVMLHRGYGEHPKAWQAAGHQVVLCSDPDELLIKAKDADAAVIIQPHNPLGYALAQDQLIQLKSQLKKGILVLDEAFADSQANPSLPLTQDTWRLRSIGKFFGLAGIRLGFVLAPPQQIIALMAQQSPWSVNHVARWAGSLALQDKSWQQQQTQRLHEQSQRLIALLSRQPAQIIGATDYFVTIKVKNSHACYESACHEHILLRQLAESSAIRLGLPSSEGEWLRLERYLQESTCLIS